jgi:lysophospholipase L1-like esterase
MICFLESAASTNEHKRPLLSLPRLLHPQFMHQSFRRLLLLVVGELLFASSLPAADQVYTPPDIPAGVNPETVPAPRQEWVRHVQENFDKTQGKHFDLVFDGDSITAGWNWQGRGQDVWNAHYAKLNAADFGIAGDQVQNVLWRLQHGQLNGINPKMVVFLIGANNITIGNDPPDQISAGIKVTLNEYLKDAPNAKFLLIGCLPQKSDNPASSVRTAVTQVNALIAPLADGKRIIYRDIGSKFLNPDGSLRSEMFVSDRVHPSAKGYQVWAEAIQPEIDKVFPPSP